MYFIQSLVFLQKLSFWLIVMFVLVQRWRVVTLILGSSIIMKAILPELNDC